jgi:hypothetical protein
MPIELPLSDPDTTITAWERSTVAAALFIFRVEGYRLREIGIEVGGLFLS